MLWIQPPEVPKRPRTWNDGFFYVAIVERQKFNCIHNDRPTTTIASQQPWNDDFCTNLLRPRNATTVKQQLRNSTIATWVARDFASLYGCCRFKCLSEVSEQCCATRTAVIGLRWRARTSNILIPGKTNANLWFSVVSSVSLRLPWDIVGIYRGQKPLPGKLRRKSEKGFPGASQPWKKGSLFLGGGFGSLSTRFRLFFGHVDPGQTFSEFSRESQRPLWPCGWPTVSQRLPARICRFLATFCEICVP